MKAVLKINKAFVYIFLLTSVALMYVNQQILIYQMGLKMKENYKVYSKLVDSNRILIYNVLDNKSPVKLETKLLAKKLELDMPRRWQVVKLESSPKKIVSKNVARSGLFASLFSAGREAEASPNRNE